MIEGWSATVFSETVRKIPREFWKTHELTEVTVSDDPDARASVSLTALTPALRRPVGNNHGDLSGLGRGRKLWPAIRN